jgi:osmotically-inducible protein OsmY
MRGEAPVSEDDGLQQDVVAELHWDPRLNAARIGVAVNDGVVTLSGEVESFAEKIAAERAVRRVAGVRALVEDLIVRLPESRMRDDSVIAKQVLDTFDQNAALSGKPIKVQVEHGVVTLSGAVSWRFQRDMAAKCITHVHGIRSISNMIEVHNPVSELDVRDGIVAAFRRMADLDIGAVEAHVDGSRVVLSGYVHSLHEANVARQAAWSSPGVTDVEDRIRVLG